MDPAHYVGKYRKGMIVKITMRDFLTFSAVTVAPGPRLNVVIGANGTGKSSILCAICLCLGGKPKLLGRADSISRFVRNGCDKATIVVELHGGGDGKSNIIVERTIYADESRATKQKYNGATVSCKEVEKKMLEMDIQIANLCQFLPQDRVDAFAKLNDKERLLETEHAVLGAAAVAEHNELSAMYARSVEKTGELATLKQAVVGLTADFERLKVDKEHFERMERSIRERELLAAFFPWRDVFDKSKEHAARKAEKARIKATLKSEQKRAEPLKKLWQGAIKAASKLGKEHDAAVKKARSARSAATRLLAKSDESVKAMSEAVQAIEDVGAEQRKADGKIEHQRSKLDVAQRDCTARLATKQATNDTKERTAAAYSELAEKVAVADEDLRPMVRERKALAASYKNAMRRVKDAKAVHGKRMRVINRMHKKVAAATFALRTAADRRRAELQDDVLGPVITSCKIGSELHAKWLDRAVSQTIKVLLIAQSVGDFDVLNEWQRGDGTFSGSKIMNIEAAQLSRLRNPRLVDLNTSNDRGNALRELGVKGFLIDLVDAPDAIKVALVLRSGLDKILYMERAPNMQTRTALDAALSTLMRESGTNKLMVYTPNEVITFTISRYGTRELSVSRSHFNYKGVLNLLIVNGDDDEGDVGAAMVDAAECDAKLTSLTETYDARKKETAELRKLHRAAAARAEEAKKEYVAIRWSETTVVKQQRRLNDLIAARDARDFDQERDDTERARSAADSKACEILSQLSASQATSSAAEKERALVSLQKVITDEQVKIFKTRYGRSTENTRDLQQSLLDVDALLKTIKKDHKKLSAKAKEGIDLLSAEGEERVADYMESHPDHKLKWTYGEKKLVAIAERDQLDEWLAIAQGRAQAGVRNENAVEEFNTVKKKLKSADTTIATLETEIDGMATEIQSRRDRWEPSLKSMITKINIKFSEHMKEMNFVGNATLIKGSDSEDPSEYALGLTVQFRNIDDPTGRASARLLNERTHSGGEKAVTTILFLISLQHMTRCPFRVVDEINQGMDAVNEGKVFSILGRETNSKSEDAPQYFLITPKLLEGLEYTGDVSVLVVLNGPHMYFGPPQDPNGREVEWSIAKTLARKRLGGSVASPQSARKRARVGSK